jgi:hypothetical protein
VRGERACTWNEGKRLGTQRAGPIFELLPLISAPSVSPPSFGLLSVLNLPSTPTHGSGHPIRPKTRARKPQTRRTTTPQACWRHRLIYPSRRPPHRYSLTPGRPGANKGHCYPQPSTICVLSMPRRFGLVPVACAELTHTTHTLFLQGLLTAIGLELQTTSEVPWHLSPGAPGRAQASHTPARPPGPHRCGPEVQPPPLALFAHPKRA